MKRYRTFLGRMLFLSYLIIGGAVLMGILFAQDVEEKQLPAIIRSPSSSAVVGDVAFPHQFHIEDLEIECQSCHHETNAAALRMPHEDYFNDFWIDCRICHRADGSSVLQPQSCSSCHHDSPANFADETLSAKVAVHKKCWECHEVETGEKASQSCKTCHQKNPDKGDPL